MIDAEAVHLTDTDRADILTQVAGELRSQNVSLVLARVHRPILTLWQRAGVIDAVGEGSVFETVHEAVRAIQGTDAEDGGANG